MAIGAGQRHKIVIKIVTGPHTRILAAIVWAEILMPRRVRKIATVNLGARPPPIATVNVTGARSSIIVPLVQGEALAWWRASLIVMVIMVAMPFWMCVVYALRGLAHHCPASPPPQTFSTALAPFVPAATVVMAAMGFLRTFNPLSP